MNIKVEYHIKKLRENKGLSLRQLADKAGISHSSLYYIETGERQPSFYVMCLLSLALETDIHNLYSLRSQ